MGACGSNSPGHLAQILRGTGTYHTDPNILSAQLVSAMALLFQGSFSVSLRDFYHTVPPDSQAHSTAPGATAPRSRSTRSALGQDDAPSHRRGKNAPSTSASLELGELQVQHRPLPSLAPGPARDHAGTYPVIHASNHHPHIGELQYQGSTNNLLQHSLPAAAPVQHSALGDVAPLVSAFPQNNLLRPTWPALPPDDQHMIPGTALYPAPDFQSANTYVSHQDQFPPAPLGTFLPHPDFPQTHNLYGDYLDPTGPWCSDGRNDGEDTG